MTFENVDKRAYYRDLTLANQQLAYLATESTGNSDQKTLESAIEETSFSKIDVRLQYLIEDLALLRSADFIDSEDWEDIWERLDEMASKNRVYTPPRAVKNIHNEDITYYQFGIQLGHLARLLSKEGAPKSNELDIIWGFILGIAGEFMTNTDQSDIQHSDSSNDSDSYNIGSSKTLKGPSSEARLMLQELQRSLVNSQEASSVSFEELAVTEALKKVSLPTNAPLRDEVWKRANEIDYPSSDTLIEGAASNLKTDDRLKHVDELAEHIATDLDLLINKHSGKKEHPVFAVEVFYAVCSQRRPNRGAIINKIRESRRDKPAAQIINGLRNDLQGVNTDNRRWAEYPLVEEMPDGYSPTDYGKLIGLIITPDSTDRDSNEYLPVPESKDDLYRIPDAEQLLTACFACAFGQPSKSHQQIFEDAYIARTH